MIRRPPRSTRTDTLFPYTTLFRAFKPTRYTGPLLALAGIGLGTALMANDMSTPDPNLWLEDVAGEKALDWVRAHNAVSQKILESDPAFAGLRDDLLAILDSDARIAYVDKIGPYYYNFWRDNTAVRVIWRRTTPESYSSAQPEWETEIGRDAQIGRASWREGVGQYG